MTATIRMPGIDEPAIELHCPRCGYSLRGTDSARCPECGLEIDREALARSVLPWTHRASMGIVKAFAKTVSLVIRYPNQLAAEASGPVNPRDARVFRWIVILLAALPVCPTAMAAHLVNVYRADTLEFPHIWDWAAYSGQPMTALYDVRICFLMGMRGWPVPSMAILLCLMGLTGIQVFFFASKSLNSEQEERAMTLSHYTSAPLALVAIPTICFATVVAMKLPWVHHLFDATPALWLAELLTAATVPAVPVLILVANIRLLRGISRCSLARTIATAVLLPLSWIAIGILTLILFPACYGFIRLVIESYRS